MTTLILASLTLLAGTAASPLPPTAPSEHRSLSERPWTRLPSPLSESESIHAGGATVPAALFVFLPSPEPGVEHWCESVTRAMVLDVCPADPNALCPRISGLVPQTCDVLGEAPPTLPRSDGGEVSTLPGEWYGFSADPMPEGVVIIRLCAEDAAGNVACAESPEEWRRFW